MGVEAVVGGAAGEEGVALPLVPVSRGCCWCAAGGRSVAGEKAWWARPATGGGFGLEQSDDEER